VRGSIAEGAGRATAGAQKPVPTNRRSACSPWPAASPRRRPATDAVPWPSPVTTRRTGEPRSAPDLVAAPVGEPVGGAGPSGLYVHLSRRCLPCQPPSPGSPWRQGPRAVGAAAAERGRPTGRAARGSGVPSPLRRQPFVLLGARVASDGVPLRAPLLGRGRVLTRTPKIRKIGVVFLPTKGGQRRGRRGRPSVPARVRVRSCGQHRRCRRSSQGEPRVVSGPRRMPRLVGVSSGPARSPAPFGFAALADPGWRRGGGWYGAGIRDERRLGRNEHRGGGNAP
jgi:hypothetical protein